MLQIILTVIHIVVCFMLVGVVLIQQGKGGGMAGAFGGGGAANTVFGAAGTGNLLTRITTGLGVAFFVLSLVLTLFAGGASQSIMRNPIAPPSAAIEEPAANEPVAPVDDVAPVQDAAPAEQAPAPEEAPAPATEETDETEGFDAEAVGEMLQDEAGEAERAAPMAAPQAEEVRAPGAPSVTVQPFSDEPSAEDAPADEAPIGEVPAEVAPAGDALSDDGLSEDGLSEDGPVADDTGDEE